MINNPEISVVIPIKNGAPWLDACISGIMKQTLFHKTEIIAIDSGSTDESLDILKTYPVRLFHIAPEDFNHGLTRQFGVELSRGEYVVMTVQDATPMDECWLENLISAFSLKDNVAGVCGSQVVPHSSNNNPVEWFYPINQPEKQIYQYRSAQEFYALTPVKKMGACGWDNVTAMYKRSIMFEVPFREAGFGEDAIWAKDALLKGYALVYNQNAKVFHHHYEDFDYSFRRNFTVMYLRYKQFGFIYNRPTQSLRQIFSAIKVILLAKPLTWQQKLKWFHYNQAQFRGRVKAYEVFIAAHSESESRLDAVHEKYCGKPPIHQKNEFLKPNAIPV